jgi:hypothetical protein
MGKDIVIMKLCDIIQFIEDTTEENSITQVEITPVMFAEENIFLTGFRMDTDIPLIHLKHISKLKTNSTQQQTEYYMMNPDAEAWIGIDALDTFTLKNTIDELNKKIYKLTSLDVLHVSYKENGKDVERNIAYSSKRIACKDAMMMRKLYSNFKLHFSQARNKNSKQISDLEFATAPLECVTN